MKRLVVENTGWSLFEIVKGTRRPVSDQFSDPKDANADERANIARELQLLRRSGIPPDLQRGNPDLQRVFKWQVQGNPAIWVYVLKAKPSHWRLYCYVAESRRRIIEFIHAVKKKGTKRDPADQEACKRVLSGRFSGRIASAPFPLPGERE